MSIVTPPERLEDYDISVINSLRGQRYIESETSDFKGKKAPVEVILQRLLRNGQRKGYTKNGFKTNFDDEDKVNLVIGSNRYEVEPNPIVDCKPIFEEKDPTTYYMLIRIDGKEIYRPYFLRSGGQCYIRVGNSSRPDQLY